MTRVAVFIDYENLRFAAREVFGDPRRNPYTFGHVNPLLFGRMLTELGEKVDPARELTAVTADRHRAARSLQRRGTDRSIGFDAADTVGARPAAQSE